MSEEPQNNGQEQAPAAEVPAIDNDWSTAEAPCSVSVNFDWKLLRVTLTNRAPNPVQQIELVQWLLPKAQKLAESGQMAPAGGGGGRRPGGGAGGGGGRARSKPCPACGGNAKLFLNDDGTYSHRLQDGTYCRGEPDDVPY